MRAPPVLRGPVQALVALVLLATAAPPLHARQGLPAAPDSGLAAGSADRGVSPRGAFLRALVVPGWGHASIGSYHRAGFYFAAEATTIYGIARTRARLAEAQRRADAREAFIRARADRDGVTDGEEIDTLLEEDEALVDLNLLVDAREQQQEDWVAFGLFLLLLSGADAFVSAHLKDFPTPLEVGTAPAPAGGLELSVRLGTR